LHFFPPLFVVDTTLDEKLCRYLAAKEAIAAPNAESNKIFIVIASWRR
jgi:hypothetical protein